MSDDSEAKKLARRSAKAFPRGYAGATRTDSEFFFPDPNRPGPKSSTTVGIRETSSSGQWLFRADNPHYGADFPHINRNPQRFGKPDPHWRIPEGGPQALRGGAKVLHTVNKVATPVAIAVDTATVAYNAKKDYDNGTTRNSVTNAAGIAGGWGGAIGGAVAGARAGSNYGPVGAIAGGIFGGLLGGIGIGIGAETAADGIGDALEYNMEMRHCKNCGDLFMARLYMGQELCEACRYI